MITELIRLDPERYGGLVNIERVLNSNRESAEAAALAAQDVINRVRAADLKTISIDDGEALFGEASVMRGRQKATIDKLEAARKPFTGLFDEVRDLFTSMENGRKNDVATLKLASDNWEREKAARNEALRKQQEAGRQKAVDQARHEALQRAQEESDYVSLLNDTKARIWAAYTSKKASELEAWGCQMEGYTFNVSALAERFQGTCLQELEAYRAELLPQIPGRIKALTEQADLVAERDAEAKAELERWSQAAKDAAVQSAAVDLEAASLDATLDSTLTAQPLTAAAKGTRVRKVYRPASVQDWMKICSQWLAHNTLADIEKKMSFALTAANASLNAGYAIEGMKTEDDYSTRTKSKV